MGTDCFCFNDFLDEDELEMVQPTIDLASAVKVAEIFRRYPQVQAVEVFGSVARDGIGNDLDLILVADEKIAQDFIGRVEYEIQLFSKNIRLSIYFDNAFTRSEVAETVLDADQFGNGIFQEALAEAGEIGVDIFIFPPDWRDRLTELQGRMGHDDPNFMEKISKDARQIA